MITSRRAPRGCHEEANEQWTAERFWLFHTCKQGSTHLDLLVSNQSNALLPGRPITNNVIGRGLERRHPKAQAARQMSSLFVNSAELSMFQRVENSHVQNSGRSTSVSTRSNGQIRKHDRVHKGTNDGISTIISE